MLLLGVSFLLLSTTLWPTNADIIDIDVLPDTTIGSKWSHGNDLFLYRLSLPRALVLETQHKIAVQFNSTFARIRIDTTEWTSKIRVNGTAVELTNNTGIVNYQVPFDNIPGTILSLDFNLHLCAGDFSNIDDCLASSTSQQLVVNKGINIPALTTKFLLFGETSKPIYKPGDIVRFRFLPLFPTNLKLTIESPPYTIETLGPRNYSLLTNDQSSKSPVSSTFSLIYIEDPVQTRMNQWSNITWKEAMQLSHKLTDDPALGQWKIVAEYGGVKVEQLFEVKEYVLPKFTIDISPPDAIIISEDPISYAVCVQYSNGRPIRGTINASLCIQVVNENDWAPCHQSSVTMTGKEDPCYKIELNANDLGLLVGGQMANNAKSQISAVVTEEGTEFTLNKTETGPSVEFTQYEISLEGGNYYKPGLPYYLIIGTKTRSGQPKSNITIQLTTRYRTPLNVVGNVRSQLYTTDNNGKSMVAIPVKDDCCSGIEFEVEPNDELSKDKFVPASTKHVTPFSTYNAVYLQVNQRHLTNLLTVECKTELPLLLQSNINLKSKVLHVEVLARGQIVGRQRFDPDTSVDIITKKANYFTREIVLKLDKSYFPGGQAVIYFEYEGKVANELIVDTFSLGNLGKSCVLTTAQSTFQFDKKEATPGSNVTLTMESGFEENLCGLRISDIGLEAFGKLAGVDAISVIQELIDVNAKVIAAQSYAYDNTAYCDSGPSEASYLKSRRYRPPTVEAGDTAKTLDNIGIFFLTNYAIFNRECERIYPYHRYNSFERGGRMMAMNSMIDNDISINERPMISSALVQQDLKIRVRELFPETWKFDYIENPASKSLLTVPDSITKWKADAFCMTENGLWVPDSAYLTVTQPFYIQVTLPYSVKRGEIASIPVTVFSSTSNCLQVQLTLQRNEYVEILDNTSFTLCVCDKGQRTVHFNVQMNQVGEAKLLVEARSQRSPFCSKQNGTELDVVEDLMVAADAVKLTLLVKPEGIPQEINIGDVVCIKQNESYESTNEINLVDNIIQDSTRGYFIFGGDVMGPALSNLDQLVKMPSGCGEQNMVSMVPSVYVLDYFKSANIDNKKLIRKAKEYITIGYKRELEYRRNDGSYSAFGMKDEVGSTWLTAFVFKSFRDASKYVDIDNATLHDALAFIVSTQNETDGCFREKGQVLHSAMKGGVGQGDQKNVLLTAYILSALKNFNVSESVMESALRCIKRPIEGSQTTNASDNYFIALLSYVLNMYEPESDVAFKLRDLLKERSIKTPLTEYWTDVPSNEQKYPGKPWMTSTTSEVETTAYAYLALKDFSTPKESMPAIRWLSGQRNSQGGFHSTQDTVVGLKAISDFAQKIGVSSVTNLVVEVFNSSSTEIVNDLITDDNRLVTRKIAFEMNDVKTGGIKWKLSGVGCAYMQTAVLFNIPKPVKTEAVFQLNVTTIPNQASCDSASLTICFSYTDTIRSSNMILLMVDYVSGWSSVKSAAQLADLYKHAGVKRVESDEERITLYFDAIEPEDLAERCMTIEMIQKVHVTNTKEAVVTVLDYYTPQVGEDRLYSLTGCDLV